MKADEFIDRLAASGQLSDRLIVKMREKLADSGGRLPAESLAEFLVQKGYLTLGAASELLEKPVEVLEESAASAVEPPTQTKSSDIRPPDEEAEEEVPLTPIEKSAASTEVSEPTAEPPPVEKAAVAGAVGGSESAALERIRARRPRKRRNEWDSPLLLLGGGGLILLLICGATVYFLLFRDTGDERLALARDAMASGSYSQAISQYEKFLEDFSGHPQQSDARVELAMARLRRATDGRSDYQMALEVAESSIDEVENEPSFRDAQDELAALLPRIARGLADQAESVAADPAAADPLIGQANRAIALLANTKYVPKKFRDDAELQAIRDTLARVERRKESYGQLQETIAQMQKAIDKNDTRAAYDAHKALVKLHPELSSDEALLEMVEKTSTAEQSGIHFVAEEQPAETDERPTPVRASIALSHHRGGDAVSAQGTVCVQVDGAVYGLDAASGQLRWRRFVGFDEQPYVLAAGDDLLVRDARHDELLRISASDGSLRWRQRVGEPFAPPFILEDRAYLAAESGKLYVVDLAAGTRLGFVEFAQRLRVTPAADASGQNLYVVGDHSSLYSIALGDFSCTGVRYLGHAAGSIRVPPVVVSYKLAVFENSGVESSRFHLLTIDNRGTATETVYDKRMEGLVVTPALSAGRRLVVMTDLGEMHVFEIGQQADQSAVTLLASRQASRNSSIAQHALLTNRYIWVADDQLTKYAVQPTNNSLPVLSIEENFRSSTFDYPLQSVGNAVVHVRRPAGRQGAAVAATDVASGRRMWELDLAVPPAGAPLIDTSATAIATASANGDVFVLNRSAIGRRLADRPLRARGAPTRPPQLTDGVALAAGKAVFAASSDSARLLVYNPAGNRPSARWLDLPGPLATPPVALGDGFLAALTMGQVFYVDPSASEPLVTAFQPPLAPQSVLSWLPPGVSAGSPDQCVLTDGRDKLYLLRLADGSRPTLDAVAESLVDLPLTSRVAVHDAMAFVACKDGRLVTYRLPSLEAGEAAQLSGTATWGPFVVDGHLLVGTDAGQLHCLDASAAPQWQVPLDHGQPAGPPLAADGAIVIAFRNGVVQKLDLATGNEIAGVDTEQSLASGPVRLQQRLVLAAHDGTLLVVDEP